MEKLLVVILVGAVATRGSALNKAVWLWLLGVVSTGVDGLSVGTFLRAKKSWIRVLLEIGGADVLLRFRDELDSECSFSSDDVDGSGDRDLEWCSSVCKLEAKLRRVRFRGVETCCSCLAVTVGPCRFTGTDLRLSEVCWFGDLERRGDNKTRQGNKRAVQ